jgi:hypothetical protein
MRCLRISWRPLLIGCLLLAAPAMLATGQPAAPRPAAAPGRRAGVVGFEQMRGD